MPTLLQQLPDGVKMISKPLRVEQLEWQLQTWEVHYTDIADIDAALCY